MTNRLRNEQIAADYDEQADVLYLALGTPVPSSSDEDDDGLIVRFALQDGHPCGVTVLGFRAAKWHRNINRLSSIVSRHLRVEPQSVTRVLSGLDG